MNPEIERILKEKIVTADEAVKCIKDGDIVYIGTCTSTPYELSRALGRRSEELNDVTVTCSNLGKSLDILAMPEKFHGLSYFMGPMERKSLKIGALDFTSVHLSQIDIWCRETCPPDVAFIEVSLPDEDGYVSFGATGVALNKFILENAKTVIVQINSHAPYVLGEDNKMHLSEADMIVRFDEEIFEVQNLEPDDKVRAISEFILDEIPDGACLQIGIGGIGNAVGFGLKKRNDLSVHSELMTDSLMELMKNGNVTNRHKGFIPGKSTVSFTLGTKDLYEFVDHNEDMYYMPFTVINDIRNIAANDNFISVNGAITIDLLGQVVADNINGDQFSGTGGQVDFVRGAQLSKGGKSFLAATSYNENHKTGKRISRIVPTLAPGTAVTTARSEVQYVVTEYGCVNLKPLLRKDRTRALISLAHPDFRDELTEAAKQMGIL
ncbi:MAG: acetyl-CoA hydrolase [Clostridiales bacterium]|nr:acetyl-CoA hydrolase [Clostridiales bacterium]